MAIALARASRSGGLAVDSCVVAVDAADLRLGGADRNPHLSAIGNRRAAAPSANLGVPFIAVGLCLTPIGLSFAAVGLPLATIGLRLTPIGFTLAAVSVALAPERLTKRARLPHPEFAAMTRPRLIATDLDGTFLRPDGSVSPINAQAVVRAAELGVPFVIATGRPTRWLGVLDTLASAHPQVIVSNGGAVIDLATREPIHQFPLDPLSVLEVADRLRAAIPGISFGFETATGFGCEPGSPSRQRSEPGHLIGELLELIDTLGEAIKLLGFHPELSSEQLTDLAAAAVADQLNLTHASVSQPYGMIELTARGVSKASTLELLCTELGLSATEVAAFGDMPNDSEMLGWAGQGFVVANGHHSMLAAGYTVVGSNTEDGVGRTVLELLR